MHIISCFILFWQLCAITFNVFGTLTIETIFGNDTINEPIIEELIASNAFQRLKKINQYGCNRYTLTNYDYTRYSHSLGVYVLLKKYKFDLAPIILGLVMGPMLENTLGQSFYMSKGNIWLIVSRPITASLLIIGMAAVILPPIISIYRKKALLRK